MFGFSTPSLKNRDRLYLVTLLILGIVLRIPRVGGIIGDDAFRVIWMGLVISEGYTELWTVSVFSIFGFYPFSFYPLGAPLVLAGLFSLGFTYELSVFMLSEALGILGTLGAYCLGNYLFESKKKGLVFAFLYGVSPIFLRVTYYTITVRGPFMAVLPWFLLQSWKLYRERRIKYVATSFLTFLILALMHRLAILMFFYLGVLLVSIFLQKVAYMFEWARSKLPSLSIIKGPDEAPCAYSLTSRLESTLRDRGIIGNMGILQILLFGVLLLGTYLMALTVMPIDPEKTSEVFLSNSTLIGVTSNLIIDYGLRIGIVSVFIPIGFLHKLDSSYPSGGWSTHIAMMLVVLFVLPRSLYASLVLLPVFVYYALAGIDLLIEKHNTKIIGISIFLAAVGFTVSYHFFVIELLPYLLLTTAMVLTCLVFLLLRRSSFPSGSYWCFLILGIVLFSLVTIDGLVKRNPNYFLDSEEMTIINSLRENYEDGIVFAYRSDLARRIQAYGIPAVVRDQVGITSLYYDWIEPNQVITWTELELNIIEIARTGQFLTYTAPYPETTLWETFFDTDLINQTQASAARELGLRFIVVERTRDGFSSFFEGNPNLSPLLESAPIVCETIFETENMVLFMLN